MLFGENRKILSAFRFLSADMYKRRADTLYKSKQQSTCMTNFIFHLYRTGTKESISDERKVGRYLPVLRIRIRIHMFLGLPDPDLDPSIIMQK